MTAFRKRQTRNHHHHHHHHVRQSDDRTAFDCSWFCQRKSSADHVRLSRVSLAWPGQCQSVTMSGCKQRRLSAKRRSLRCIGRRLLFSLQVLQWTFKLCIRDT